jgi:hypothetical protein
MKKWGLPFPIASLHAVTQNDLYMYFIVDVASGMLPKGISQRNSFQERLRPPNEF